MKFYAGPKFLFSNMMHSHTFDVDFITNTILTIMKIITSKIPSMKQYILIVSMFQMTEYSSKTHIFRKFIFFNKYNHVSIYTIVQYREDLFRRAYKCFGPHFTYVTRLWRVIFRSVLYFEL
jgi:hypothetical protein